MAHRLVPLDPAGFSVTRFRNGTDVLIRVIRVNQEGLGHLSILRQLSRSPSSLLSQNHTLHMLDEIESPLNITFGIFPIVGSSLAEAVNDWAENSLGDVMEMYLQALEALKYIHTHWIAHRDAFLDNFLVQWQPESLLMQRVSHSHPRVYLTDFELAIQFPEGAECICYGLPSGGSIAHNSYGRSCPDDVLSGGVELLLAHRVSAEEAYNALASLIDSVPPESLLTNPGVE
ncbi:hypothetical protein K435DRAFT_823370 [Dendrothele bispora CBS 962.96]|uniref:Protein kinase domain-containing protein n=1 Tax=Dendrothele bispora (strain CBS 962.96) TaxID=1314807 RepID=A0A4S8L062_DENBC|nr:hypothetical protein K435DRAFT_823370 [Dendrothele bispora CBS 962.96]